MPINIDELVVKMELSNKSSGDDSTSLSEDEIVERCVEQVFQILEHKMNR